jgi:glycine/D-amino acid oxidase-like deaminating enzyme
VRELSDLSLWHATMTDDEWGPARAAMPGDQQVDVAIVGGGYTGLWTAYYLLARDPALRVAILEADAVGFGASGRNGGWCSSILPMGLNEMAAKSSRDGAIRLQKAMHDTVREVGRVASAESIDCDFTQGGYLSLCRSEIQLERENNDIARMQSFGFAADDYRMLSRTEALERCGASGVVGASFTPHCAALHPARLARGLARVVERMGATIYEHTRATSITPHAIRTEHGTVTADVIVRATEAFTPALRGMRRFVAPIYSLMVATEPLPKSFWDGARLHERSTFNDGRHMIIYGQRTADDRFAFGGRGARYHWGSKVRSEYDRNDEVHNLIHQTLRELFPAIGDAKITHRWGGAVAAARDWWCQVSFDRPTGIASAGAYLGDGVSTTNLAGRTLADLITDTASDLTTLPWVGHQSRKWEPEPLRFIGINSIVRLPIGADRHEERKGRRSRWREAILNRLTGH